MATDSFLALTCVSMLGLLFGFILAFSGYRFFLFLLPFWGFFWGFGLGAQSIQALFNSGFLADVTSWVVGFFLGIVFAVLSYLFFAAAVAILAGSLGYTVGVGIMTGLFGYNLDVLTWIVGIVLAIVFIVAVFALDLYKWAIILATSILGAGVIVGTFLFIFGKVPASQFVANPVKAALNDNPLWWILAIVIAVLGFAAQYQSTRNWTLSSYSRWEEVYPPATPAAETIVPSSSGMTTAMAGASASGMAAAPPASPAASAPAPSPAPPANVPAAEVPAASTPAAEVPPAADATGEPPAVVPSEPIVEPSPRSTVPSLCSKP